MLVTGLTLKNIKVILPKLHAITKVFISLTIFVMYKYFLFYLIMEDILDNVSVKIRIKALGRK